MHIHLHASTVRGTFRKVANAAMLTASERADGVKQREKRLLSQWKAEYLAGDVSPLWCVHSPVSSGVGA